MQRTSFALTAVLIASACGFSTVKATAQSGDSLSVSATVDYMNNALDKDLSKPHEHWRVLVDERLKKIWIVQTDRFISGQGTVTYYKGALAKDIDPDRVVAENGGSDPYSPDRFSDRGPYIDIRCTKEKGGCVQTWCRQNGAVSVQGVASADFLNNWGGMSIFVRSDEDASDRFARAFRHLVAAVRALPTDSNDPFAK